jgi:hypothetical protein
MKSTTMSSTRENPLRGLILFSCDFISALTEKLIQVSKQRHCISTFSAESDEDRPYLDAFSNRKTEAHALSIFHKLPNFSLPGASSDGIGGILGFDLSDFAGNRWLQWQTLPTFSSYPKSERLAA